MIRRTTLIFLVCAVALGAGVYFFDWKRGQAKEGLPADKTKPAYSFAASDLTSLTVTHPQKSSEAAIRFTKQNGTWEIIAPIETGADQASVDGIAEGIASSRIAETEPGTPDRLKVYGLDPPDVVLDFQLRSGAKHELKLGSKDFTGVSVYAIVDNAKDVALLPESLLISSDKSLEELRDRSVAHFVSALVTSLALKNPSGELEATKDKDGWKFTRPTPEFADSESVDTLLAGVAAAKFTTVVSETPEGLTKYGLASPKVIFRTTDDKGKTTLFVGKKEGEEYFARDPSRSMIFRIDSQLYKKLSQNYADLRDKRLVRLSSGDVTRFEIRNSNGTIVCTSKPGGQWVIEQPKDEQGKSASSWKFLDPILQARAEEIFDHPSASLAAHLVSPQIQAVLTDKSGRKVTTQFSKASGDVTYAQTSEGHAIFKLKSQVLKDLDFKASDLAD